MFLVRQNLRRDLWATRVGEDQQSHSDDLYKQTGMRLWEFEPLPLLKTFPNPGVENRGTDLMARGGPLSHKMRLQPKVVQQISIQFGRARWICSPNDAIPPAHCDSPLCHKMTHSWGWTGFHMRHGHEDCFLPSQLFISFLNFWREQDKMVDSHPGSNRPSQR